MNDDISLRDTMVYFMGLRMMLVKFDKRTFFFILWINIFCDEEKSFFIDNILCFVSKQRVFYQKEIQILDQ